MSRLWASACVPLDLRAAPRQMPQSGSRASLHCCTGQHPQDVAPSEDPNSTGERSRPSEVASGSRPPREDVVSPARWWPHIGESLCQRLA